MKKFFALLTLISFFILSNNGYAAGTSISLSRGFNGVDGMNGFAIAGKSYWNTITQFSNQWQLAGYWNLSLSYWHSNDARDTHYSNITVLALSPVLRYRRSFAYDNGIAPFFDLGYGIGLLNRQQFSDQKLGGHANFVTTLGAGINFGQQAQYDLTYHYLVYNNAAQFKNDDGMFINTLSFTYHFAP